MHAGLRGGVRSVGRIAGITFERTDVDDRPDTVCGEVRRRMLAHEHRPSEVDREHAVPRLDVLLVDGRLEHDPGVVHDDVQATVIGDDPAHECLHLRLIGHVERPAVVHLVLAEVADDDRGACSRQPVGDGRTDAACAAGDDSDTSFQTITHPAEYPPSMGSAMPVTWLDCSLAR